MAEEGILNKVTGGIQGTGNLDMAALGAGALDFLSNMGMVLLFGVIISAMFWFFYSAFFKYNIDVQLKVLSDGKVLDIKKKKARKYKDKKSGVVKLQIQGLKKSQPFPEERFRQRKGRRDFYEGVMDANDNVYWMDIKVDPRKKRYLEPEAEDRRNWAFYEEKDLVKRIQKENLWDKYKDLIVPLGAFILAFLITFFFFKEIGGAMNNLSGQFGRVADTCARALGA